jgi:hypothetical protein
VLFRSTATALAQVYEVLTQTAQARPDEDVPTVTPTPAGAVEPVLPDAGLFDDVSGGGLGMIALAAFGLLGVIAVSRRLRARSE